MNGTTSTDNNLQTQERGRTMAPPRTPSAGAARALGESPRTDSPRVCCVPVQRSYPWHVHRVSAASASPQRRHDRTSSSRSPPRSTLLSTLVGWPILQLRINKPMESVMLQLVTALMGWFGNGVALLGRRIRCDNARSTMTSTTNVVLSAFKSSNPT